jgi:hypothetical protein
MIHYLNEDKISVDLNSKKVTFSKGDLSSPTLSYINGKIWSIDKDLSFIDNNGYTIDRYEISHTSSYLDPSGCMSGEDHYLATLTRHNSESWTFNVISHLCEE